jgi:hypothetical protein
VKVASRASRRGATSATCRAARRGTRREARSGRARQRLAGGWRSWPKSVPFQRGARMTEDGHECNALSALPREECWNGPFRGRRPAGNRHSPVRSRRSPKCAGRTARITVDSGQVPATRRTGEASDEAEPV